MISSQLITVLYNIVTLTWVQDRCFNYSVAMFITQIVWRSGLSKEPHALFASKSLAKSFPGRIWHLRYCMKFLHLMNLSNSVDLPILKSYNIDYFHHKFQHLFVSSWLKQLDPWTTWTCCSEVGTQPRTGTFQWQRDPNIQLQGNINATGAMVIQWHDSIILNSMQWCFDPGCSCWEDVSQGHRLEKSGSFMIFFLIRWVL